MRTLLVVLRNPTRVVCRRSGNGYQTPTLRVFMTPLSSVNVIRNKKQVVFILCRHGFSKLRFCHTNKTLLWCTPKVTKCWRNDFKQWNALVQLPGHRHCHGIKPDKKNKQKIVKTTKSFNNFCRQSLTRNMSFQTTVTSDMASDEILSKVRQFCTLCISMISILPKYPAYNTRFSVYTATRRWIFKCWRLAFGC